MNAKMKNSDIFINRSTDLSIFSGTDLELATFIQKVIRDLQGDIPKTFLKTQMVYYGLVKEEVNYLKSI